MAQAKAKAKTQSRAKTKLPQLEFIFTQAAFVCDPKRDENGSPLLASSSLAWLSKFEDDRMAALYELGLGEPEGWFTPSMRFLHRVASTFIRDVVGHPDVEVARGDIECAPDGPTVERLLLALPFAPGAGYVDAAWIEGVYAGLRAVFKAEIDSWEGTIASYVAERTQNLRVAGRIFFHLVDNPDGAQDGFPFAFVATYATSDEGGKVVHVPLRYALTEYEHDQRKLLGLLGGLGAAAEASDLVSELMESGELFHPLRIGADDAHRFLLDVSALGEAGVICRVPNWWRTRSSRAYVSVRVGQDKPAALGADALLSLAPSLMVDGVALAEAEIEDLLRRSEGLAFIKGKWVEVDHARLGELLQRMEDARGGAMGFFEALRTVAAAPEADGMVETTRGAWLDGLVQRMRDPAAIEDYEKPPSLAATLRPYQQVGFSWLSYLAELGFGSCLADDMGLGKTVQVLAYIERTRQAAASETARAHVLLVVPASLVGNWTHEIEKFAPQLDCTVLYGQPASRINATWDAVSDEKLDGRLSTLSITTYAMAQKIAMLERVTWDAIVLDEAQAIKNPATKQSKFVKGLKGRVRIALTGTPVENDLGNLWSIFDFANPGLLGTAREFGRYVKQMEASDSGYAPLRQAISPFILRRLKTDKSIISDLPDKMEIPTFVELAKQQVMLYRKVVKELELALHGPDVSGIKRDGLVLSTIMKLKQVCNHPDQYLGQSVFDPKLSGKFRVLGELAETVFEKRERMLVFTQFKEMCAPLDEFLRSVFGRPGLVIHGGVAAKKRTGLVDRFQGEEYVPYMVLSLKAAGVGLNLTAANHVVHFDRWWNPAVENQATDRAFRIGQSKDVMVYKFVCQNTLEERISQIIEDKSRLMDDVVGTGEAWLGKLGDAELLDIMRFGREGA